jgi:diketogulonate reductase-like aldo/keto reductase
VAEIADQRGTTRWQVALAWVLRRPDAIAIPKASREGHLRENHAAPALRLSADDLARLDAQFAAPRRKRSLDML